MSEPTLTPPKLLVVSDDPLDRRTYRDALSVLEAEILEAADGAEALDFASEHDFAVILLDLRLRGMTALEVASLLRMRNGREYVPIIVVAPPDSGAEVLRMGYRVGAVDCLTGSPNDGEILRQKVQVFLHIHRRRHGLRHIVESLGHENRELERTNDELMAEQDRFRHLATHDPLTSLPNRTLFENRLDGALRRCSRTGQYFALAFLDLDRFKSVNDRHGHAAGDELIVAIARRLVESVRRTDTVARIGGDEFAILFESLDSTAAVAYLAGKVAEAAEQPWALAATANGTAVTIQAGVSMGIAVYPEHGASREELLRHADTAMYVAKRSGGGVAIHQPSTNVERAMRVVGGTDPRRFARTAWRDGTTSRGSD